MWYFTADISILLSGRCNIYAEFLHNDIFFNNFDTRDIDKAKVSSDIMCTIYAKFEPLFHFVSCC